MTAAQPRLVVLISGSGSNLQALIDACRSGQIPGRIVAVISNKPDAGGLRRAVAAGIPEFTLDHRDFGSREQFDDALARLVDSFGPDLVILAGFMRILTPTFVGQLKGRLLNIHPSLLPKYTGLHTHQRALEAGDIEAGATVHFVTENLDGGPAIIQASVPIKQGDTVADLAARVLEREHRIYPLAVKWFCQGRVKMQGQRVLLDNKLLPVSGWNFTER